MDELRLKRVVLRATELSIALYDENLCADEIAGIGAALAISMDLKRRLPDMSADAVLDRMEQAAKNQMSLWEQPTNERVH